MNKPKYSINDSIIIRKSAEIGFIERYKVSGVEWNPQINTWVYRIDIRMGEPSRSTTIDANDRSRFETLRFRENELVTYCEALNIAIDSTQRRLDQLLRAKEAHCGTN